MRLHGIILELEDSLSLFGKITVVGSEESEVKLRL